MSDTRTLVCVVDSVESPLCAEVNLEREVLGDAVDVALVCLRDSADAPPQLWEAGSVIVSHHPRISCQVLQNLRQARVIVRNGVGYDNVDVEAAAKLGIPVCNVPDYGTEEVADHALLLTLALERRLQAAVCEVRAGGWSWQAAVPGRRIRGQKFGVVGCGRIGTATALRAKAFGFHVQFFDPYVTSGYEKALGVGRVATLRELLHSSDVVSFHAPLTAETRGMLGEAEFALMKPGALLINTARGAVVKERALLAALERGQVGGAALDVVEQEPTFRRELLDHPNCIITPHMAFYSGEALREMRETAARIVLRVLEAGLPVNVVNGVTARRRAGGSEMLVEAKPCPRAMS